MNNGFKQSLEKLTDELAYVRDNAYGINEREAEIYRACFDSLSSMLEISRKLNELKAVSEKGDV